MGGEDADYVCTLDAASVKKAKDELNENPEDRLAAVQAFRDWVKAQAHITWPALDTRTLLIFLRGAKFSQIRAREMIEGNLRMRVEAAHWFKNVDTADPKLQLILDTGHVLPLPRRNSKGEQIFIQKIGVIDPYYKQYSKIDAMRVGILMGMYCQASEMTQVNGTVFIVDFTGVTTKHITNMVNNADIQKWHKKWQKNAPGRFKKFIMYNAGSFVEALIAFCKPIMSKKFQERIAVCETAEALYRHVPMELLPEEYLPDDYTGPNAGSTKDLIASFKKDMMKPEVRDNILYRTGDEFAIDDSKRPNDQDVPTDFFRKLNVD